MSGCKKVAYWTQAAAEKHASRLNHERRTKAYEAYYCEDHWHVGRQEVWLMRP